RYGAPEFRHAFGLRITMRPWMVTYGIDQAVDNGLGSRQVRIPHRQVDDVELLGGGLQRQRLDSAEYIRRQVGDFLGRGDHRTAILTKRMVLAGWNGTTLVDGGRWTGGLKKKRPARHPRLGGRSHHWRYSPSV